MKRPLLIAVCCLLAVLSAAAAQVPDKTKELVQKIEPSLQVIEKQLDEIEADFWKNVRELDTGSQNFLSSNPLYQSFNQKIVDFVSCCGALQRELYDSGVDIQLQYPIGKQAIGILSVWKRLPQLHERIMGRRNPITREGKIALGEDCIASIYQTSKIPTDLLNYGTLLDDIAIVNMELFYITCRTRHLPPDWNSGRSKYCKLMSEDLLITSAGEFFMAVCDLRKIILGLRTKPYPEPVENTFYAAICHIENDLNQIESEFWDTIYKGGSIAVSNKNLSRYSEFQRFLYCLQVDCRNFQTALRQKKIDSGEYNPVTDSIIIYNLGRSHDQELRRQMRRFFNRDNPLEPGSKKKRIEFVYHFRAYDANAKELLFNMLERGYSGGNVVGLGGGGAPVSTSSQVTQKPMPYGIRSYLPYAELVLLNIPERLDEFCTSNIAFFKSDEREFQALGKSAEQYFNAVKGLRRSIEHWKNEFAPPLPSVSKQASAPPQESPQVVKPVPQSEQQIEPPSFVFDETIEIPDVSQEELFKLAVNKLKQKRIRLGKAYLTHLAQNNHHAAQYILSFIQDEDIFFWGRSEGSETDLENAARAGYIPAVERWLDMHQLLTPEEQDKALHFTAKTQLIWRLPQKIAALPIKKRDSWVVSLRKRALEGDVHSQLLTSYCYAADDIIDQSPSQAKKWLLKAAENGQTEALLLLWGWRPYSLETTDEAWRDKAIAQGGIPVIVTSTLEESDLSAENLARLEDAGRNGDELAMCALVSYYFKRQDRYLKQLEKWKQELELFRTFQRLLLYPNSHYSFYRGPVPRKDS